MEYFNESNINKEYDLFKKDIENKLRESTKPGDFNDFRGMENGMECRVLEDYLYNEILYCFIKTVYSSDTQEKRFHSNVLIRLFGSFLDLYAQILNSFYDLKLIPLRKNISSAYGIFGPGIIAQAINGVDELRGAKIVQIENVCREIELKYTTNEYYNNIRKIISSKELKAMGILRNYVTHYQSIFSEFNCSYLSTGDTSTRRTYGYKGSGIDETEYENLISLSREVVDLIVELILNFNMMYFKRKLVKKNEDTVNIHILKCPECNKKFQITELLKKYYNSYMIKIKHEGCLSKEYLSLIDTTIEVHPERYQSMIKEEINGIESRVVSISKREDQ